MKLAFVTTWDPHDRNIWAGTGYHMARALQDAGCELEFIGPLREKSKYYFKGLQITYRKLWRQDLQRDREPIVLDGYAEQIAQRLKQSRAQIVFGVGGIGIAHLQTNRPIAFWADATYAAMVNHYRFGLPVSKRSLILGNKMETQGLDRAAMAIYSSDWAAESAIRQCRANPKRVHVVPFGANIESARTRDKIEELIASRPTDRCRLLYIGTGWERKGGDIALDVAQQLNESGLPTELILMGSDVPPASQLPSEYVRRMGFIDKSTARGRAMFDNLFGGVHFLILPARAEAFGVVLCEAGSYGVPALASRVGGIPTIVRENRNGLLFPPNDPASIVSAIRQIFADRQRYKDLARASFHEYESRLNWNVAGHAVKDLLQTLIA